MTRMDKKMLEKNLDLIFEFEKYVLEHPERRQMLFHFGNGHGGFTACKFLTLTPQKYRCAWNLFVCMMGEGVCPQGRGNGRLDSRLV